MTVSKSAAGKEGSEIETQYQLYPPRTL